MTARSGKPPPNGETRSVATSSHESREAQVWYEDVCDSTCIVIIQSFLGSLERKGEEFEFVVVVHDCGLRVALCSWHLAGPRFYKWSVDAARVLGTRAA